MLSSDQRWRPVPGNAIRVRRARGDERRRRRHRSAGHEAAGPRTPGTVDRVHHLIGQCRRVLVADEHVHNGQEFAQELEQFPMEIGLDVVIDVLAVDSDDVVALAA